MLLPGWVEKRKLRITMFWVILLARGNLGLYCCVDLRSVGWNSYARLFKRGRTRSTGKSIMQHLSGHPGIELCSGGRLIDQMVTEGPFSEQRSANVMKEGNAVVKYCHEMGVVHGDLKPENILLTISGKIKLADFGLAMRFSSGWILFHTERTIALSTKLKQKNHRGSPSLLAPRLDSNLSRIVVESIGSPSRQSPPPLDSTSCNSQEPDECGYVDALSVAISLVRISEQERTRLCSPTGPIEQQCSSNLRSNTLCKAC